MFASVFFGHPSTSSSTDHTWPNLCALVCQGSSLSSVLLSLCIISHVQLELSFSSCSSNDRTWPGTSSWLAEYSRGSGSRATFTLEPVASSSHVGVFPLGIHGRKNPFIYYFQCYWYVLYETGSKDERLESLGFVTGYTQYSSCRLI